MNTDRIEKSVLLHAPQSRVWRALTDSGQFGSWFGMRFDGPFVPGATVRGTLVGTTVNAEIAEAQKEYEGLAGDFAIDQVEPERLFSFRWHPFACDRDYDYSAEPMTLVTFTLEPAGAGTRLTVVESGFDRIPIERRAKAFAANEGGWAVQVTLIEEFLRRGG